MAARIFKKNWLLMFLVIFLVCTIIFLMNYTRLVAGELAEGKPGKFIFYFIMESTGAYTIVVLIPLLILFFNRFPITRENIYYYIPIYILVSMVFGVCHTLLMYFSRTLIFWIFNMGPYNYGRLIYRFPMEYSHQFIIYCTVYIVILLFKNMKEYQEQRVKTVQLQQQLTKVRLQALEMQLHPHFLFNTLNMISSTMYEDAKAADSMIASLSHLLRITLDRKGSEKHTLENELEIVGLYIEIMRARYKDKLIVHTHMAKNTLDALVPGFILQPLVENSIKFSMENLKSAEVHISSLKDNNTLKLIIQDNGPGISGDPDMMIKNGIGLSNTAERLEKLYGANHCFHLQDLDEGGLRVTIQIPFQLSSLED